MTLRDLRTLFTGLVPGLIDQAFKLGYEVTIGEVVRGDAQAKWNAEHGLGITHSLHLVGLAIDLNLFQAGKWITDGTGHTSLGVYWKERDPLCRWGGDFRSRDYGHYSVEFQGRR